MSIRILSAQDLQRVSGGGYGTIWAPSDPTGSTSGKGNSTYSGSTNPGTGYTGTGSIGTGPIPL